MWILFSLFQKLPTNDICVLIFFFPFVKMLFFSSISSGQNFGASIFKKKNKKQLLKPINWQLQVYNLKFHAMPKNQKRFQRIREKYLMLRVLRLGRAGGYFVACATASKWVTEASPAISSWREKNRVEAEKRLTDHINIPLMSLRKQRVPAKSLHKQVWQTEPGGQRLKNWFSKLSA